MRLLAVAVVAGIAGIAALPQTQSEPRPAFLAWSADQAEAVGQGMYETGRVGGFFDTRILQTNRSFNYKLAATWLTPDVIRATVRIRQIAERLTDDETLAIVGAAVSGTHTTVMVEIDPREGSGVIPLDWLALLEPRAGEETTFPVVRGRLASERRLDPAFAGVRRRNYDYDRFWVEFPLTVDGQPAIPAGTDRVDLVVRIHDKEGRVTWPLTGGLKEWLRR